MRPKATSLLLAISTACMTSSSANESPLPPDKELVTFHFADPDLTADLIAAEPDVISPVCVAWDADGRMFVVEMTDYPLGPTGGRVRLLEDRDGDGRHERVTIFADRLPFPTSVLPWRDGVLVAAAPDIWFLKDTDGDGRADERRKLFTGFGEGNQQLRVNGLTWGLDNWVYGANGRSDGEIRRPDDPTNMVVSIRRRDFRFRIDPEERRHAAVPGNSGPPTRQPSLQFEAIAGQSQFGTTFDDWGNRFLSWNTMPFRHVVIETRYLDRVPQLAGTESSQNLQPDGDDGRIFPLTAPPQLFNNESQTHFNASAGTTVYRGDALGENYKGNLFVGEPLRNLVHRRVLVPKGVTFEARRAEEGKEFLASTDPWFHPVYFTTGPDGALCVVDFYRELVEHPGYVPEEMRNKVDWRIGAEHGRIWRIRPKNWKPKGPRPNLSHARSSELVKHLDDANAWWRVTAQRLLVERKDKSVVPALEKTARKSQSSLGRLHALCTLEGLGALGSETIMAALRDSNPSVREQAVLLSEPFMVERNADPEKLRNLEEVLLSLRRDRDAGVRLQSTLTLGMIKPIALSSENEIQGRWQSLALLCGAAANPRQAWFWLTTTDPSLRYATQARIEFVEKIALLLATSERADDLRATRSLLTPTSAVRFSDFALFSGLVEGAKSNPLAKELLTKPARSADGKFETLEWIAVPAKQAATSREWSLPIRLAAIRVLGRCAPWISGPALCELISTQQDSETQIAAVRALGELNDPKCTSAVFTKWAEYSKSVRRQLIGSATRSSALAGALLDALEKGAIQMTEVDPSTRQALEKNSNTELKERAQRLFRSSVSADREVVIRQFKPATTVAGDRPKGAAIFARACLQCHAMQGRGNAVGPNLYSVASQPKETLLVNILDPSRQVTPDFVSYSVTTADGETLTGLLTAESPVSVTIRRPNVPDATIQRSQIMELKADGKSLMPDGLEQGLTQQDFADLLEFLRQPDDRLLPEEK